MKDLEAKAQSPEFWKDPRTAAKISQEISDIREELEKIGGLEKKLKELKELFEEKKHQDLKKEIKKEEFKIFLSGKYDKGNAILEIQAGAGGVDAQDWATMLIRMFERFCVRRGFQTKIIHQSFGEGGGPDGRIGIKSAVMEIKGKYAYGFLKNETGVHRLVRISPFSAQKLRHTSFVLIGVLPEIEKADQKEIELKQDDLKTETFRSSGPGGQNVNKRETAIRITHLPTGIVVSSQVERTQAANRENALKILYSKLFQLKEAETKKELKKVRGEVKTASWGNQIRSYVLAPYKMVKDHRIGVETSDVEKVLDGELDEFIEAELKISK